LTKISISNDIVDVDEIELSTKLPSLIDEIFISNCYIVLKFIISLQNEAAVE